MKRVVATVCQLVGVPKPVGTERKFLVNKYSVANIPVKVEQFEVDFTYLVKGADDIDGKNKE